MKATYIPTTSTQPHGLPPEKLAACLARYSRSNKGIEALLQDAENKSPEEIFKFIDYGHASIGGLTGGIAIAIDGVTMVTALKLFEYSSMADGQESSTRYINLSEENLGNPQELGLPKNLEGLWKKTCLEGLDLYKTAFCGLQTLIDQNPEKAKLPDKALQNPKVKARMLKNYALDRARNFLPASLQTNLALVMSARSWAETIKLLDSLPLPEPKQTALLLREELKKAAPNLIKHSFPDEASTFFATELLAPWETNPHLLERNLKDEAPCQCNLELFWNSPKFLDISQDLSNAFRGKTNRYSQTGTLIKRQTIQVEWSAMALAEVRDLNRHRTGFRTCDLNPKGFEIPEETKTFLQTHTPKKYESFLISQESLLKKLLMEESPALHTLGLFLGHQTTFEHTQQLDKFLYEAELRTGLGAHFRYHQLLKQASDELLKLQPNLKTHLCLGEAEPE